MAIIWQSIYRSAQKRLIHWGSLPRSFLHTTLCGVCVVCASLYFQQLVCVPVENRTFINRSRQTGPNGTRVDGLNASKSPDSNNLGVGKTVACVVSCVRSRNAVLISNAKVGSR